MKVSLDRADLLELVIDYANDRMGLKIAPADVKWIVNGQEDKAPKIEAKFEMDADVNGNGDPE